MELFRAWKEGDARAGEALFRELRIRLRLYFRRHPRHELDDLVQETLVACVVARRTLRCEDALLGYVYTAARRILAHHITHRSRPIVAFDDRAVEYRSTTSPDALVEVQRLLRARSTPLTRVVVLRHVEGYCGVEIARRYRVSEASIRRWLRRGLDELRESADPDAST